MSAGATPRHTRIGRYEVTGWLGSGSFAAVYLGYDPALDATVALKVLGDHHSGTVEIRERFIQEARMLRRLASDRVVTVRDIGEIDGQPYFVMDAFESGTLADRLATAADGFDAATIRRLVTEIGLCLVAVHDGGLIHRDLKPSNLLIGGEATTLAPGQLLAPAERLVVGDFGIARDAAATGLTRGAGTDGYMAPEQNAPLTTVDHRVDIYAATAIVRVVVERVWNETDRPQAVTEVLLRGLAENPDDRPATAAAWTSSWLAALPVPTEAVPATGSPSAPLPKARPRRLARLAVASAAVVAAVLLAVFLAVGRSGSAPEIVGPERVRLGETVVYSFEPRQGAEYSWLDSAGRSHPGQALRITPRTTGDFELILQQSIDNNMTSTSVRVEVVDS